VGKFERAAPGVLTYDWTKNGRSVYILIPAYNSDAWITNTLSSSLAQTWKRKKIIVVVDGSCDRTAEVGRRVASREVSVTERIRKGECEGDEPNPTSR
jgi:cellulose synthase/poly-beta-1,6-N-acetylglucosamine synthase-like glycosyltransferase